MSTLKQLANDLWFSVPYSILRLTAPGPPKPDNTETQTLEPEHQNLPLAVEPSAVVLTSLEIRCN